MPLMLTVTVGCVLVFQEATIGHVAVENTARWVTSDYVLLPSGTSGLPAGVARAAAAVPGVAGATAVTNTWLYLDNRSFYPLEGERALGVDPSAIGGALDFGVTQGSLADLRGDAVAVSATVARDRGWHAGDRVHVWLNDGSPATLRLAAVFGDGIAATAVLPRDLAVSHARDQVDAAVYVTVAPGADRGAVGAALRGLAAGTPALAVASRDDYLAQIAAPPPQGQVQLYGLIAVLVIFTAVAIVNTLVMANAERTREFALLRLVGTTRAQVARMVGWEAAIIIVMGVGQGTLITVLGLLAFSRAFTGRIDVAVQPGTYALMVGLCVFLGFGASLLPAWLALRAQPVRAMGVRE
jgi:putative ABC transport system permease protein